jgi:hypothetical protein
MQISGLVITLELDADPDGVRALLGTRPEFLVGEAQDRWLPVAMEAPDEAGSWALHDWLRTLPGILHVDVVHVRFTREDAGEEVGKDGDESSSADRGCFDRVQSPQH